MAEGHMQNKQMHDRHQIKISVNHRHRKVKHRCKYSHKDRYKADSKLKIKKQCDKKSETPVSIQQEAGANGSKLQKSKM